MPEQVALWGWDNTNKVWVKVLVNATGKLIIDPSEILEDTPTDGEVAKAPTSNWAHDHAELPDIHHVAFVAADHTAIGNSAPHHAEAHTLASHTTKAHSELTGVGADDHHTQKHASQHLGAGNDLVSWTDEKLLKGAGAGVAPEEIDIPSGGYTQGARVYHNASQNVATDTLGILAFNSERYDTDVIHNTVTNNSRLTCKTAGIYVITGHFQVAGNATGRRIAGIQLNGATAISESTTFPDLNSVEFAVTTIYSLAVNDYVELYLWQNSGVTLSVIYAEARTPEFMMQRIG